MSGGSVSRTRIPVNNKVTPTTEDETTGGGSIVSNSGFNKPEIATIINQMINPR